MKGISPFLERSCKISADFLQTAVIIDDQAYPADESKDVIPENIEPMVHELADLTDEEVPSPSTVATALEGNNPIDTKGLVRAFAGRGIVCAVIDPPKDPGKFQLAAACRSADIAIVDWYLYDLSGEYAKTLIRHLIEDAEARYPYQFRLILIYTTEQNLEEIRDKIATMLNGFGRGVTPLRVEGTALRWGSWRFVVLAKPGTDVGSHLASYEVPYADLADRAIYEFARAVCGLVPNTALRAISSVRANTHRLIGRLSKELDAPFLTHRALLPNPSDAEELLVTLITSEFQAILEDEEVGQCASLAWVQAWIEACDLPFPIDIKYGSVSIGLKEAVDLARLLEIGAKKHIEESALSGTKRKKAIKQLGELNLTRVLADAGDDVSLDELFALFTTQRPHYGRKPPLLTLGSILKAEATKTDEYWLCIQPRCDSVRVKTSRPFLFLPLEISANDSFCTVAAEQDKIVRLRRQRKPYEIRSFVFSATTEGVVRARQENDRFVFVTNGGKKLTWLGQLRNAIAQNVAHDVSTRLSRVGVNASEWLRHAEQRGLYGG